MSEPAKVPRLLSYTRNKHFGFTEIDNQHFQVSSQVQDSFYAAELEMLIDFPEWRIRQVQGQIRRSLAPECRQAIGFLDKLPGVCIGAGLTRQIDALVGGPDGCTNLANMVLESCHTAIDGMHFHMDQQTAPRGISLKEHQQLMLQQFPYLKHQCIRWSSAHLQTEPQLETPPAARLTLTPLCRMPKGSALLTYDRSKYVNVGRLNRDTFWVQSGLQTTVHGFTVQMQVRMPGREIVSIQGWMPRAPGGDGCQQALPCLQKALGVRIESGLTSRIDAEIGRPGCPRLANLVLEGCHAILPAMLGDLLQDYTSRSQAPEWEALQKEWLESLPLMRNSCLTYSDHSAAVRRIGVKWVTDKSPL